MAQVAGSGSDVLRCSDIEALQGHPLLVSEDPDAPVIHRGAQGGVVDDLHMARQLGCELLRSTIYQHTVLEL